MIKRVFAIFTLTLLFLFSSSVYSLETSSKTLEKYTKKISSKFTRTYCNTTKFGISYEGALAFAIGETNKEFKNNKLNKLIDYSFLKNSIVNDLENNCQVYDFALSNLEKYGNTSAATIPLMMDEAVRDYRIKQNDIIATSGFGAGLSWGAALIKWG